MSKDFHLVVDAIIVSTELYGRAVGVTVASLHTIKALLGCSTYRAKKIRALLVELNVIFKDSGNGRYYLSTSSHGLVDACAQLASAHTGYVKSGLPF